MADPTLEFSTKVAVYSPLNYNHTAEQCSYPAVIFVDGFAKNAVWSGGAYNYLFDRLTYPPRGGWYIWEGKIYVLKSDFENDSGPKYFTFEGEYKPATESQIKLMVNGISPFPIVL